PIFRRRLEGPEMHILANNDYQGGPHGGWQSRPAVRVASVDGIVCCADATGLAARTELANSQGAGARGTGPRWRAAQGSAGQWIILIHCPGAVGGSAGPRPAAPPRPSK